MKKLKYIKHINTIENVFNDNLANIQLWDFSQGNINDESRIEAITKVASVCYDNPNAVGKENLYNRLKSESMGLPSSSFEFVPVLLSLEQVSILTDISSKTPHIILFGEYITHNDKKYILTNYRALLYDYEEYRDVLKVDITQWYNTEKDCEIINKYNKTFLYKMDISTSKQHNRHRVRLQELSRRYVSGKKSKFEFYISENMKPIISHLGLMPLDTYDIHKICEDHYYKALKEGVEPQEARRILPQSMYTTIWSAFLPYQLKNYIKLRSDKHAQWEIRQLAEAMKKLIKN